ncbi:hypothetical protein [Variovorax sp. Sphag1AA]|uniref:hypothetical protein n=1 Tax=Variovorax sp. Sphag1AA TaxID=2587027 RepID=UPI0017EE5509|nr:hypothetical protein [Variovorax sp. Sphag1AA]MBB3181578.1 peroxiredoxin [Variovorax sp. Sphag1AA]
MPPESRHAPGAPAILHPSIGTDIPVLNGNGQWVLPVPATYVIDTAGKIRFAFIEEDIRKRAEPREVLAAMKSMGLRV